MEKHLYQPKPGLFDKLFHTYRWQIGKCMRLDDGWFDFAIKHKLDQKIELEGMDMGNWYSDPRLNLLLIMLCHTPDCDSEHMLSVLKAKMPEIIAQIKLGQSGVSTGFHDQYRTAIVLLEKKKDIPAALLLDILTATAETVVKNLEMSLQEYKEKLEAIGFWSKQPFMEQVDNLEKIKELGNEQQILFYQKDTRGEKKAWQDHWLNVEFWRASAYHNIYMTDRSDLDAKRNATEAMNQFLTLDNKFGSYGRGEQAKAIAKLLNEEY